MKHYKDANNNIYAYESDGSQDDFIMSGLVPVSDVELAMMLQPAQAEIDAAANAAALAALRDIDIASIRSIREYIVSKNDAPQFLKDREAVAQAERAKLR